ncbi:4'-phosphopantetheinyl transferase superfamily protein [Robbsia sp. Bb-Pol-6]|uniref:4'-phosphopantetheinyl transferase superfamily protein n=1 Tax=Robbsia betulipollinis TaxID=2981849 RepID=A0ABT3ZRX5_9BURK|nr:4'-phosphopantetheinyl transferase superfamily protein [Robbsia betulipollinis]MCY0388965.1 4'-phosphopantetheinyl transferase superfamily protein [Robbsia betulipollinis]
MIAHSSNFEIDVFFSDHAARCTTRDRSCTEAALRSMKSSAKRTALGKPYLSQIPCFGFSDTARVQAYLLANRKYVGIDLESSRRDDLARRASRLAPLLNRKDEIEEEFLTLWVAKEACAKCVGLGLLQALPHMRVVRSERSEEQAGKQLLMRFGERHFVVQLFRIEDMLVGLCYRRCYGPARVALHRIR